MRELEQLPYQIRDSSRAFYLRVDQVLDGPGARGLTTETYTDVPGDTSGSYSFDGVSGDVLADTGYTASDFSVGEERLTFDSHTMDVVVMNEETQQHQPASSDLEAGVSGQIRMNGTGG